ncbi:MAG: TPR end-of-group domain-containing protein [Thermoanaerobaculia bacterium]
MPKRWRKEEITYLKRWGSHRTLAELAARFKTEVEAVREKLDELEVEAKDYTGGNPDPGIEPLERALTDLYAERWERATKRLHEAIEAAADPALAGRAREYLAVCEQRLATTPATVRDPYLKAVIARNQGDLDQALKLSTDKSRRDDDRFAYLAAAIYSLQGDLEAAAEHLRAATRKEPRHRIHARNDSDFAALRDAGKYAELFEPADPGG